MKPSRSRSCWRLLPAAALLLASCSVDPLRSVIAGRESTDRDMYTTGYEQIEEVFIDQVDVERLALAGLQGLATFDARLAVNERSGQVALLADGAIAYSFAAPGPHDAEKWGALTAETVAAARRVSPALHEAADEDVYEVVFDAVVERLDDFSRYASAKDASENRATREGFGGIGVRISVEEGEVLIVSVMHYTPAERAGLRADDVIAEVDGRPIAGIDQEQVIEMLRGPVGSKVRLTIRRGTPAEPFPILLVRAHVVPETVTYRREGDVAYFRIYSFNLETADSLRKEVANAERDIGGRLKGLVLDLRGNPGGLLDQAVAVADLFVEEGRIVSTHGRHPDSHQYFEATEGDIASGLPIAILINGGSASASEIVAAALQDDGRAVIIGSNSFGKGTVQTVLRMPNDGELTLTWARFHAPSGYTLHRLGVLPTLCTKAAASASDIDALVDKLRHGAIAPVPTAQRDALDPSDVAALDRMRASCPMRSDEDESDLRLALKLLGEPALYDRALALAGQPDLASAAGTEP